jgi:hypothetical protein
VVILIIQGTYFCVLPLNLWPEEIRASNIRLKVNSLCRPDRHQIYFGCQFEKDRLQKFEKRGKIGAKSFCQLDILSTALWLHSGRAHLGPVL